ncbi:MAG: hypothetical protein J6N51_06305 [Selenomonas sp.]|nr:hypothetical protein [Selenomonas sp.]
MDYISSKSAAELEDLIRPKAEQLIAESLRDDEKQKLEWKAFDILRKEFLCRYALKNANLDNSGTDRSVRERWSGRAAMLAWKEALKGVYEGYKDEKGRLRTFAEIFEWKYKLAYREEKAERVMEINGVEYSKLRLQNTKRMLRLLMGARGWGRKEIESLLDVNLLNQRKMENLLGKLVMKARGLETEEELEKLLDSRPKEKNKMEHLLELMDLSQEEADRFQQVYYPARDLALDAVKEDEDGDAMATAESVVYDETQSRRSDSGMGAEMLVAVVDRAAQIAGKSRGKSEEILRYWVTLQLAEKKLSRETEQALQVYKDHGLEAYLAERGLGRDDRDLQNILAEFLHKTPESVRKDLKFSVTNSSSKVQKLLFQAATELKREGKL